MARTEARILASIWTDSDFLAMTQNAQWAYVFLLSQPDLSYAGVLPLRVRRWAGKANDMTADMVVEALRELECARFVVTDPDTEELMIRSFIRGDEIYKQPNLVRAARKALAEVVSVTIRAAMLVEVERCIGIAEKSAKSLVEAFAEDLAKSLPNPSENPSPKPSAKALGEGGSYGGRDSDPPLPSPELLAPVSLLQQGSSTLAIGQTRKRARSLTLADSTFDRFWAAYPRRVAKDHARKAWAKAAARADPELIIAAAARYRDDPGRDPSYTAHPATWLNGGRWADDPLPRGSPRGQREHNGHLLNEGTIANMEREQRIANGQLQTPFAIEGPAP